MAELPSLVRIGMLPRIPAVVLARAEGSRPTALMRIWRPQRVGGAVQPHHQHCQVLSWLAPERRVVDQLRHDRLMEFPHLAAGHRRPGTLLLPNLANQCVRATQPSQRDLLDWGCGWRTAGHADHGGAGALMAKPLTALLFHYGAFSERPADDLTYTPCVPCEPGCLR